MKHGRVLAAIAAVLIGSVAPAAQARPAADPKAGVLVDTWQAGPAIHGGDWAWPDEYFIYDAVMSGRFGPIETLVVDASGSRPVELVRRWERVDDFSTCARVAEVPGTPLSQAPAILLTPRDRDLVQGRCVAGRLVPAVTAAYVVFNSRGEGAITALKRRSDGRRLASRRGASVWALFGLPEPENWFDVLLRPDEIDDDDLIRAFSASPRLRDAGLLVIRQRTTLTVSKNGQTPVLLRPTSRRVGEALASSGLLRAEAADVRADAIAAAGEIPAAADLLVPEILAGLAEPAEPIRVTELRMEATRQGEVFDLAALNLEPKWMRPGSRHPMIAPAAALAAAELGPDALARVWPHVEARALEELGDGPHGYGDQTFIRTLEGLCAAAPARLAALAAEHPDLAAVQAAADACPAAG